MAQIAPLKIDTSLGMVSRFATGDTILTSMLGTGTADGTKVLRGDGTWATVSTILGYTPLNAGGATSGSDIVTAADGFYCSTDAGGLLLRGHDNGGSAGAYLHLYGKDNPSSAIAGHALLRAYDGTNQAIVVVKPTGLFVNLTGTDQAIWHAANDGTGSTLDSDLLDGQHGSYYRDASNLNAGTVPTARLGSGTANNAAFLRGDSTWSNTITGQIVSTLATGTAPFSVTSTTVNTNLNADLLDGYHASGLGANRLVFTSGQASSSGMATATGSLGGLELQASGSAGTAGAAYMTFHRPSAFAAYFGLDTDNVFKVGGWSLGANAYTIWHAGNLNPVTTVTADAVVKRDGSGYINASYINCAISSSDGSGDPTHFYCSNDDYIRRKSVATVQSVVVTASAVSTAAGGISTLNLAQNCNIRASTGGAGTLYSTDVRDSTTANGANMVIDGTGGFIQRSTSSARYKRNIQNMTHGLAEVLQLRPVTYQGKGKLDGDKVHGGLISEEVHAVGLTEFVTYQGSLPDGLAYGNMVSLLVKAIQELTAEVRAAS